MKVKKKQSKGMRRLKFIAISLISLLIILSAVFYIYTLDYYKASDSVQRLMNVEKEKIINRGHTFIIEPDSEKDSKIGLIFYPGGKVEATSYIPLLLELSKEGITCLLVEMPMNLAVFNVDAADDIYDAYPHIDKWYLAGHSLGGAMASSYMKENSHKVDGLILLGAYPVNESDVDTLVIYGSEDIMLDLSKLESTANKFEISGGNHAYFGNYGEQEGDGNASLSRQEQQEKTVEEIIKFIYK